MSEPVLGQRQTRQRDAILEVIRTSPGPLTIAEIHERALDLAPGLGIATVYRTLKLLQESDLVRTVILPGGDPRYESVGLGHHHHFQCRMCKGVYDLGVCPVDIPGNRPYAGGFLVEDHEVILYGICPGCA